MKAYVNRHIWALAQDTVWGPGINAERQQYIKSCPTGGAHQLVQKKEPMLQPANTIQTI